MQLDGDGQETPDRTSPTLDGFCVGRIVQLVPSHASASVASLLPLWNRPTAMHMFAALHDMAERRVAEDPDGLGVDRIDQVVPFQASASDKLLGPDE